MRHRLTAVATAVCIAGSAAPGHATSDDVRLDGAFGPVRISRVLLERLGEQVAAAADPQEFVSALPHHQQVAVVYALSTIIDRQIIGSTDGTADFCPAEDPECIKSRLPDPADPPTEVGTTPPPADPCAIRTTTLTAKTLAGTAYQFHQTVYRCWTGTLVTDVSATSNYSNYGVGWRCITDQAIPIPFNAVTPPNTDAPMVDVTSVGECRFGIKVVAFGQSFGAETSSAPRIQLQLYADGRTTRVSSDY